MKKSICSLSLLILLLNTFLTPLAYAQEYVEEGGSEVFSDEQIYEEPVEEYIEDNIEENNKTEGLNDDIGGGIEQDLQSENEENTSENQTDLMENMDDNNDNGENFENNSSDVGGENESLENITDNEEIVKHENIESDTFTGNAEQFVGGGEENNNPKTDESSNKTNTEGNENDIVVSSGFVTTGENNEIINELNETGYTQVLSGDSLIISGDNQTISGSQINIEDEIADKHENTEDDKSIFDKMTDTIKSFINTLTYYFKFDDGDYIQLTENKGVNSITFIDPESYEEITIMDRNLGAETNDYNVEESYGYYYQWGNNNGITGLDENNLSSIPAIYSKRYEGVGYTRDNKYRIGNTDIWEEDEEGRSNYDELWYKGEDEEIQGPCPIGYHIPTVKEWNNLLITWTKIHTLQVKEGEEGKVMRIKEDSINEEEYSGSIISLNNILDECGESDYYNSGDCIDGNNIEEIKNQFIEDFKIPHAGNFTEVSFNEGIGVYWTSTPSFINSYQSEVFNIDKYFGGEEENEEYKNRATGNPLRCFLNNKLPTYNDEEIIGEVTNNGVTVKVVAPVGSFYNGTELRIEPIRWWNVGSIKEQLVEEKEEIKEDSTVVAFDIAFIYKGEEVQPLSGNTVSVTFNYENNEDLKQAEEDKKQEVKVYHINDKDDEGNKVDEKEIENIDIVESNEGELVVDAESFSIYTIVTQVAEEGPEAVEDQLANFEYGMISIENPNNPGNGITIMDRNLGAIQSGTGTSFLVGGYLYQWGNNYGFSNSGNLVKISNNRIDTTGFGPGNNYYSDTYIIDSSNWSSINNRNLWGGESDTLEIGGNERTYGVNKDTKLSINPEDRQGPCPDGWHVPSIGEWSTLIGWWVESYGEGISIVVQNGSLNGFSNEEGIRKFKNYFRLSSPYPRGEDASLAIQQSSVLYQTSTSEGDDGMIPLEIKQSELVLNQGNNRSKAYPIRCFKNDYIPYNKGELKTVTFNFNGGSGSTVSINVLSGEKAIRPTNPVKGDLIFLGWYEKENGKYKIEQFDFENEIITEDKVLYAKWGENNNTVLLPGQEFNKKIKSISKGSSVTSVDVEENNIISIERYLGDSPNLSDAQEIQESGEPVYAWLDNGVLYYYSNADEIYINPDATKMLFKFKSLTGFDFTQFETSLITGMESMFQRDSSLEIINMSGINLRNLEKITNAFNNCTNLKEVDMQSISFGKLLSLSEIFKDRYQLEKVNLKNADLGNVTNLYNMFMNDGSLKEVLFENLIASNVTNISGMFGNCSNLESVNMRNVDFSSVGSLNKLFEAKKKIKNVDMSDLDISSATDMSYMFNQCTGVELINMENIDAKSATNIVGMFNGTTALKKVDMTNADFRSLTSLEGFIRGHKVIEEINMSGMNISNVTTMSYMFYDDTNLKNVNLTNTDVENLITTDHMFQNCTSLTGIKLNFKNTDKIENMQAMFYGARSLADIDIQEMTLNNVSKFNQFLYNCTSLTGIDLSGLTINNGQDMSEFFRGCTNLKKVNLSNSHLNNVQNMSNFFRDCSSLEDVNMSNMKASGVTTIGSMFRGTTSLRKVDMSNADLRSIGSTNLGDMNQIFQNNLSVEEINMSGLNISSATRMDSIFNGCTNLKEVNLTNIDARNATNIGSMFSNTTSLKKVDMSNADFRSVPNLNQFLQNHKSIEEFILEGANLSSVNRLDMFFDGASNLKKVNFKNLDARNATTMSYMFRNCSSLTGIVLDFKNINNLKNMEHMFEGAGIQRIDLSKLPTNKIDNMKYFLSKCPLTGVDFSGLYFSSLSGVDWSYFFNGCTGLQTVDMCNAHFENVQNMDHLFNDCSNLENISMSNMVASGVTNVSSMFAGTTALKKVDMSNSDLRSVGSMEQLFKGNTSVEEINMGGLNLSGLTRMDSIFNGCTNLKEVNLTNIDAKNTTNIGSMFSNTTSLKKVDMSNADLRSIGSMERLFNGNTSIEEINMEGMNLSGLTRMDYMFNGCTNLEKVNFANIYTENLNLLNQTFAGCSGLVLINFSGFVADTVTSMNAMFEGCTSLETLDLSTLNFRNTPSVDWMFHNASNLKTIYVGQSFNPDNIGSAYQMFNGATNIVGGNGTVFDSSKVGKEYAKIDDENNIGYFTNKNHFALKFVNPSGRTLGKQWKSVGMTGVKLNDGDSSIQYYTDSTQQTAFDFQEPLRHYTEVYTIGDNIVYQINFYNNDKKTIFSGILAQAGQYLPMKRYYTYPNIGLKYWFDGWYTSSGDFSIKNRFEFDKENIEDNVNLYPHWLEYNDKTYFDAENPENIITYMDRNLGATTDDVNDIGSYGYHYQWGNNHGFTRLKKGSKDFQLDSRENTTNDKYLGLENFGPDNPYFASNFYYAPNQTDWANPGNDNMYGGSGDSSSNLWGLTDENKINRQGPCPDGYHVPSVGELDKLVDLWIKNKYLKSEISEGILANQKFEDGATVEEFKEDLLIPLAGYRYGHDGLVLILGEQGRYLSSTPMRGLSVGDATDTFQTFRKHQGQSIRCFKNQPLDIQTHSVTFNSNGGDNLATLYAKAGEQLLKKPLNPTKVNSVFTGWYTNPQLTQKFDLASPISNDITLYAKRECETGSHLSDDGEYCIKDGENYQRIVITGVNNEIIQVNHQTWEDLTLTYGDKKITIMDRNLGALISGTKTPDNDGKNKEINGYYFQWGNNYGFPGLGDLSQEISTGQVETIGYGPNNYYASSVLINNNVWDKSSNQNLWGGISGTDDAMQGPCPNGYHIPRIVEWQKLKSLWCSFEMNNENCSVGISFASGLNLPFAGYKTSEGILKYWSNMGPYWSSNHFNDKQSSRIYLTPGMFNIDGFERGNALPIRCFKNTTPKTITYQLNSGDNNQNNPTNTSSWWEEGTPLLSGTRFGYVFKGWYSTSGFDTGTQVTTNSFGSNIEGENIILYANWEPNKYTITYKANGGEGEDIIDGVAYDSGYTVINNPFIREGYTLSGWNTQSDGNGQSYEEGFSGVWNATDNITLYAEWKPNKYTITYKANGGEGEDIIDGVAYDSGYTVINNPFIREGYTLSGWNTQSDGNGQSYEEGFSGVWNATDNITLYAEWKPNKYTITYKANGGEGEDIIDEVTYDSGYTVINNPFIREGYIISGWNTQSDGNGKSFEEGFSGVWNVAENITLYAEWIGCLTYETIAGTNNLKITGLFNYDKCKINLVIPNKIDDKWITEIGDNAFYAKGLTGALTFQEPSHITTIGSSAFKNNNITGTLKIPGSVGTVNGAFSCNPIEKVIFGTGITTINSSAFRISSYNCDKNRLNELKTIKSVEFPSTLTSIGQEAFQNQVIEGELKLPEGLTNIGNDAFYGNNITGTLKIPGGIGIVNGAFSCNPVEKIIFGTGITTINDEAFRVEYRCNSSSHSNEDLKTIKSVEFPSTLTSIGARAFERQIIEGELKLPSSLTSIGDRAFFSNNITGTLEIPGGIGTVNGAFSCNPIEKVIFGTGITTINSSAFRISSYNCDKNRLNELKTIKSVEFPSTLTSIGQEAFQNQVIEGKLKLPEGLTNIGNDVFYGNRITGELILPNSLQSIGDNAFSYNAITGTLVIPGGVTTVTSAFKCTKVEKVVFEEGVRVIKPNVFESYCSDGWGNQIKSVEFPSTLTGIGDNAFNGQTIENNLILPESLESVGESAFNGNKIQSVYIPKATTEIKGFAFSNRIGNHYTTGYTTDIKDNIDYLGARIKPLIKLYTYTFVDTGGNILGTGYYQSGVVSDMTKRIPIEYYTDGGNIEEYPEISSGIIVPEGKGLIWNPKLPVDSIAKENLILTATIINKYTVSFETFNAGEIPSQGIVSGETIVNPGVPEIFEGTNYIFSGWYLSGLNTEFDFNTPISEDITLYAKWSCEEGYRDNGEKCTLIPTLLQGQQLNGIIKTLGKGETVGGGFTSDSTIEHFEKYEGEIPEGVDKRLISTSEETPVYAWYSGDNKTLYYHTLAPKVFLNNNSSHIFNGLNKLKSLDMTFFDSSRAVSMDWIFGNCSSLTEINLSNFNTSSVTNIGAMFAGCKSLIGIDLSNFDTSNVTTMVSMFNGCSSLVLLDVSGFDTSNVTNIGAMFAGCSSLTSLDLSNFDTSNVTNMESMFNGCNSLTSLDLSNFDTSNVTTMESMFNGCSSLVLLDVSGFDTSNVTNIGAMFAGCSSLIGLDVSKFNTNNVTNMGSMFKGCSSLTSLDLSNFDTSNVTNMSSMFNSCSSLTGLDVSSFNTSNATTMSSMFNSCSSLTGLDVSKFNTSNVTNMESMFNGCSSLTGLDVSKFNTSNVTTMRSMFNSCSSLTGLDVSKFNTSNVTNMESMFNGCSSLTGLDVSKFNTSNVTTMRSMFNGCSSLTGLDVSSFDTSNVTNMQAMFNGCSSLTGIDVSSFDTSNVTSIINMFSSCNNLKTIYASDSFTNNLSQNSWGVFSNSTSLLGGNGTKYNNQKTNAEYARIDSGDIKGYFTDPRAFTVRFLSGTETISTQTISTGGYATGIIDNTRIYSYYTDYTDHEINTPYDFTTPLYTYTEIYVTSIPAIYTVTYDAESHSGTISNQPKKVVEENYNTTIQLTGELSETAISQKEGYQFMGWTTELGGINPITEYTVVSDVTFYPIFKKNIVEYTALFSGNGSKLIGDNQTGCVIPVVYNTGDQPTSCNIITPSIQRVGYDVLGFDESQNHEDICSITGNQEIAIDSNKTYYAITKKELTATFDKNGNNAQKKAGEQETTDQLITEKCTLWNEDTECSITTPEIINPSKNIIGYSRDAINSGDRVVDHKSNIRISETPISYFAWSKSIPETYNVIFTGGYGIESISKEAESCTTEVKYNGEENATGCKVELPEIVIKYGYRNPAWYNGMTAIDVDDENNTFIDSDKTLTAKAQLMPYVINVESIDENKGLVQGSGIYEYYTYATIKAIANSGYDFSGWKVNGELVSTDEEYQFRVEGPKTLQAEWKPKTDTEYRVEIYEQEDGSYPETPTRVIRRTGTTDEIAEVEPGDKEKDGYLYDESQNNIESTRILPNGDGVLTIYLKKQYEVRLFANSASGSINNTLLVVDYGTEIIENDNIITVGIKDTTATPNERTDKYTHIFSGWSTTCNTNGINESCEITAQFISTINKYKITFVDEDGVTPLWSGDFEYETNPIYGGSEPTKAWTPQYTYEFSGWTPQVSTVYGEKIYIANYRSILNKYTITWNNSDGTELEKDENVPYGNMPTYDGAIPTSGKNAQYTYEFSGWIPNTGMVIEDTIYTANYKSIVNEYPITWIDGNGDELKTDILPYGATPNYEGSTPAKTRTAQYTYTFNNTWLPEIESVKTGATYTAQFDSEVNQYQVNILSNDEEIGTVDNDNLVVDYGTEITENGNVITVGTVDITAAPNQKDAQYTYIFNSWLNNCGDFVKTGCTITANFDKYTNSYQITFNSNGGTPINYQIIKYGEKVSKPANPTRVGYDFRNWYYNGDIYDFEATITTGFELDAEWNAISYSIDYNLNGGTNNANNPKNYTIESNDIQLEEPTRDGYTFEGWSGTDIDGLSKNVVINSGSIGNRKFEATWKTITYEIEYDLNNGTNSENNPLIYTIESGDIQLGEPTREGYVFEGWSGTEIDGISKTVIIHNGSIGARVYEAIWNEEVYEITYNLNGGIEGTPVNPSSYTIESGDIELTNPTRVGYTFMGWSGTNIDGASKNVVITSGSIGDRVYEAIWKANTYQIQFHSNNGENRTEIQEFEYDKEEALRKNIFEKTGYTFTQWNAEVEGTGISYADEEVIENLATSGVIDVYAQWIANNYAVRYHANQGSGEDEIQNFVYDEEQALRGEIYSRTGYNFLGWNTLANGEGTNYTTGQIVKNLATDGNVDLYAQWGAKKYTITYVANLGEGDDIVDEVYYDANYTINDNIFKRTGYTFSGWNTKANGEGQSFEEGYQGIWKTTNNVTLYAIWNINYYTIIYDAGTHSGVINNQAAKEVSKQYKTLIPLTGNNSEKATSEKGYTFIGWTTEQNGTGVIDEYELTGDITFYPVFKKNPVEKKITFYLNGNSGFTYNEESYYEDKSFNLCKIPARYNTDDEGDCSAEIELGNIIISDNTPNISGWSTTETRGERTDYEVGTRLNITVREDSITEFYAQTYSLPIYYIVYYDYGTGVKHGSTTSSTCNIPGTNNGVAQSGSCNISLPLLTPKTGYVSPYWYKKGTEEYITTPTIPISHNGDILEAKAQPKGDIKYVIKHYFQMLNNDGTGLSNNYILNDAFTFNGEGTGDSVIDLEMKKLGSIPEGFHYWKGKVNNEDIQDDIVDLSDYTDSDYDSQATIDPEGRLVIKLFYKRNLYTITWMNGETELGKTLNLPYGVVPVYSGIIPTKSRTPEFTYEFANSWTPEIHAANSNATYYANYNAIKRSYTITWIDEDNSPLTTTTVLYGDTPEYLGDTPKKASNPQYNYTFSGWTPEIIPVNGTATYKAQYSSQLRSYLITWKDGNGKVIQSGYYDYGTTPDYEGEIPTKTSTAQTGYEFNESWNPSVISVQTGATYTAQFYAYTRKYPVVWLNENDEIIKETEEYYGTNINTIKPDDQEKASTIAYDYTFDGWYTGDIKLSDTSIVQGLTIYKARFNAQLRSYPIWFKNYDGEVLQSGLVLYGTLPVYTGTQVPSKPRTQEYSYEFNEWTPGLNEVGGETVYTAVFKSIKNKYPIQYLNEDGSVLWSGNIEYGDEVPSYNGTPTKQPTEQTGYSFNGWTPTPTGTVTGPQEYRANYTEYLRSYEVKAIAGRGVGSIEGEGVYEYGEEAIITGTTKEGYHFGTGDTHIITGVLVTGDMTIRLTAKPNHYIVEYLSGESEGTMEPQEFAYDEPERLHANTFTKQGYKFNGWKDEKGTIYTDKQEVVNLATTGIVSLIAQWEKQENDVIKTQQPAAGGGRLIKNIKNNEEQEHNSAEENNNQDNTQGTEIKTLTSQEQEILSAYEWAYKHNVTTMPTLEKAMPDGVVKRGHLAKMVVNYATNILGREIPEKIPSECRWNDNRKDRESDEIKDYAVKSCALGLMGLDMPKFLPNMEVTRAQFGTIISRLLWGKKYAGGTPYYRKHLNALKENNIMTQIENPEKRIELRQWVWLMLMRSAENK